MSESERSKKERLFIGIPLDEGVRNHIEGYLKNYPQIPGRHVPSENWHITLFFIGDVESGERNKVTELLDSLKLAEPFEITIGSVLAFPKISRTKILSIGLEGDFSLLSDLADRIGFACEGLGFQKEDREYTPHITISRLKRHPENTLALLKSSKAVGLKMKVQRVVLYRSVSAKDHSQYQEIKSWPLI